MDLTSSQPRNPLSPRAKRRLFAATDTHLRPPGVDVRVVTCVSRICRREGFGFAPPSVCVVFTAVVNRYFSAQLHQYTQCPS